MANLRHDGGGDLRRQRLTHDGDQSVTGTGLRDLQCARAHPGERHGDFEGPRLRVETHRRQLGDAVREENTAEVDHLVSGPNEGKFRGPGISQSRVLNAHPDILKMAAPHFRFALRQGW